MTILNLRSATGFALFCVLGTGLALEKNGAEPAPAATVPPAGPVAAAAPLPTAALPPAPQESGGFGPEDEAVPDPAIAQGYRGASAQLPADQQEAARKALAEDLRLALH